MRARAFWSVIMAFRFKLDETFNDGLQRIGREQIRRARTHLEGADVAVGVHEARKGLKRLRALLQLVRTGIGEKHYAREYARFRAIGRMLSGARDDVVRQQTICMMMKSTDGIEKTALLRLQAALAADVTIVATRQSADIESARHNLLKADRAWRRLRLQPDDFGPLQQGLAGTYAQCRALWAKARRDNKDSAYHDWRKDVQRHWRQTRLLQKAWPDYFAARDTQASELSEILGNMQDLAMLAGYVAGPGGALLERKEARHLLGLIRRRQRQLRLAAEPRAARLCAEGPSGFARRAAGYWETAKALNDARAVEPLGVADVSGAVGSDVPARQPASVEQATVVAARSTLSARKQTKRPAAKGKRAAGKARAAAQVTTEVPRRVSRRGETTSAFGKKATARTTSRRRRPVGGSQRTLQRQRLPGKKK